MLLAVPLAVPLARRSPWFLDLAAALEAAGAWTVSLLLMALAAYAAGFPALEATSYVRFDSGHYLTIAAEGYYFFPCAGQEPDYPPEAWCGNAGWFPGYPLLIRALGGVLGNNVLAGWLIANGFGLLALLLLAKLLEQHPQRWLLLLLAALFPGGMYHHALFPISALACCTLLTLLLLRRGQLPGAALAAAAGGFFYSTGFLLSGVVGLGALLAEARRPWPQRLGRAALYGGVAFSGFLAVLALHQGSLGHWDAFFLTQAKYGHGLHNPLAALPRFWAEAQLAFGAPEALLAPAQSLLIAGLALTVLGHMLARPRRAGALEWLAAAQVAAYWLFPLTMGPAVSLTRAEALLLPMVLLLARLPPPLRVLFLVGFAVLRFQGGVAFFRSAII